ncbi:type II toxin-antitoxin system Phd/YefM family antitoxin [Candidatus Gottesmanbacteria bacterium]|nr:type II toxin-antitoxin system Phd/YefM family antitoxin [Candidatus Gottesmanbacteria bacterium]
MTYVLPVTEARKNFLTLVDRVNEEFTRVDITKKGKVRASIVSPDYIDSLEETIYTLQHSMPAIRKAQKEIREGKYVTLEEFLKGFHAGKTVHSPAKRTKTRKTAP